MSMCTLTTKFGIMWQIVRLANSTAFIHNRLVIAKSVEDNHYHLLQSGRSVYKDSSVGECLDISSEMILDAYAVGLNPSWDDTSILELALDEDDLDIEEAPITDRYPPNYTPNWAEADT